MIRAIIVEDEPRDLEVIIKALKNFCPDVDVVATASSIAEAETVLRKNPADLLFLDIELQDGRAFDLLTKIQDIPVKIVFTTAHPEYAVRAFRFSAVDYLLKPLNFTELQNAVERVKEGIVLEVEKSKIEFLLGELHRGKHEVSRIAVPERKGIKFVAINDIIYIEADGNYSRIKLSGNQDLYSSRPIKDYEDILTDQCFVRVGRSHIVNLNHITEYKTCGEIVTDSGVEIPVGRQYKENLLNRMNGYDK
jgi:two-component system, LytTR family, response regulator